MQGLEQIRAQSGLTKGAIRDTSGDTYPWIIQGKGDGWQGYDSLTGDTGPVYATYEQALVWTITKKHGFAQDKFLGFAPVAAA